MANGWKTKAKELQRKLKAKNDSLDQHVSVLDEYSKEIKSLKREVEYWKSEFIHSENRKGVSDALQDDGYLHAVRKWNADCPDDEGDLASVAGALGKRTDGENAWACYGKYIGAQNYKCTECCGQEICAKPRMKAS